jgi:trimeric autotransporter adhesin
MKNAIILSLIIFTIIFNGCEVVRNSPTESASQLPTQGLISYYPFNGNINDESGNGNTGILYGATLTTDRFGNPNKAYNFNGGTNRIQIDISNMPIGNSSRTFSLWANGNHYRTNPFWSECILMYGGGVPTITGKDAFGIYYNHDPLLTGFGIGISFDIDLYYLSSDQFFDGQWKHIVIVYNQQTSKMTFYINNQKIDEQVQMINTVSPYYHFNIGIEQGSGGLTRPFYGKIDDVRVYDRVLSEIEIQQLYHEGGW